MPDAIIPGVPVSAYYLDAIMPVSVVNRAAAPGIELPGIDAMSLYLLDLMRMQEYRVVSGVSCEVVPPEGPVSYPTGWTVLRVSVQVQEFDVDVEIE